MNIKSRIERLSEALSPAQAFHEYTAEEWIAGLEKIGEEHSPAVKYLLERFIKELDGRYYPEVLDTDKTMIRYISYILSLIKGKHLNINRMPYDRIKGIDQIIESILSNETNFHQCGECGCDVPITFKACPVCGGKTDYALYHYTGGLPDEH